MCKVEHLVNVKISTYQCAVESTDSTNGQNGDEMRKATDGTKSYGR